MDEPETDLALNLNEVKQHDGVLMGEAKVKRQASGSSLGSRDELGYERNPTFASEELLQRLLRRGPSTLSTVASTITADGFAEDDEEEEAEDPMEIDIVLAILEQSRSNDALDYANNAKLKKLFRKCKQYEDPEIVVLSECVTKVNKKGSQQPRILVITDKAIYNVKPKKRVQPDSIRRRIDLASLSGVTLADTGDEFVLHVAGSYDYHFISHRRQQILHTIGVLFKQTTGDELVCHVVAQPDIRSFITTKQLKREMEYLEQSSPNAGTSLAVKIRSLVSKKKVRYEQNGFNLDLTYITDRLMAMGYPSEDVEALYRNPYTEVYRFLEMYHHDHYKVYNLCSERKYDTAKFHYRVGYYPFDDHNAPPLQLMLDFCLDVHSWLDEDPNNIVAVHCKAGKGRTGVMLSAYMVWAEMFDTAEGSLTYYGRKRTHNGKGVTIPSQQRYVRYFERMLREYYSCGRPFVFSGVSRVLTSVRFHSIPRFGREKGCRPYFKVYVGGEKTYDSRSVSKVRLYRRADRQCTILSNARVSGDFKVVFCHEDTFGSSENMFHCWLNTNFIENNMVVLAKVRLDKAVKDKHHKKFDESFSIEMGFRTDDIVAERNRGSEEPVAAWVGSDISHRLAVLRETNTKHAQEVQALLQSQEQPAVTEDVQNAEDAGDVEDVVDED